MWISNVTPALIVEISQAFIPIVVSLWHFLPKPVKSVVNVPLRMLAE